MHDVAIDGKREADRFFVEQPFHVMQYAAHMPLRRTSCRGTQHFTHTMVGCMHEHDDLQRRALADPTLPHKHPSFD
jgi:hypothetical protein